MELIEETKCILRVVHSADINHAVHTLCYLINNACAPFKICLGPSIFLGGGGTHATQIHMYVISRYTEEHIVRSTLYGQQNVIKIKPDLIISGCLDIIYSKNVFASYFCFFKFRGSKLSFELGWCHVVAAFSKDPCNISLVIYVVNINLSLLQSIGDFVDQRMSLWKNKVL